MVGVPAERARGEIDGEAIRIEAAAEQVRFQAGSQPAREHRENQKAALLARQLAWPFRPTVGSFARIRLIASIPAPAPGDWRAICHSTAYELFRSKSRRMLEPGLDRGSYQANPHIFGNVDA
jgi:hypothetical protein